MDDSPECAFSSCPLGEDPFSIVLGQGMLRSALQGFSFAEEQTIVGLEAVLKSMLEGEVAVVRIPPDQGFGAGGNPHGFHGMASCSSVVVVVIAAIFCHSLFHRSRTAYPSKCNSDL